MRTHNCKRRNLIWFTHRFNIDGHNLERNPVRCSPTAFQCLYDVDICSLPKRTVIINIVHTHERTDVDGS